MIFFLIAYSLFAVLYLVTLFCMTGIFAFFYCINVQVLMNVLCIFRIVNANKLKIDEKNWFCAWIKLVEQCSRMFYMLAMRIFLMVFSFFYNDGLTSNSIFLDFMAFQLHVLRICCVFSSFLRVCLNY